MSLAGLPSAHTSSLAALEMAASEASMAAALNTESIRSADTSTDGISDMNVSAVALSVRPSSDEASLAITRNPVDSSDSDLLIGTDQTSEIEA